MQHTQDVVGGGLKNFLKGESYIFHVRMWGKSACLRLTSFPSPPLPSSDLLAQGFSSSGPVLSTSLPVAGFRMVSGEGAANCTKDKKRTRIIAKDLIMKIATTGLTHPPLPFSKARRRKGGGMG